MRFGVRCGEAKERYRKDGCGKVCGDASAFVAIDADTKLVISWLVGRRDAGCATEFLRDVESRMSYPIQLTTDGHKMYLNAVPDAFASVDIDYAQLIKIFGNDPEAETRYSPAQYWGIEKHYILGDPDPKHVSTSYTDAKT